MRNKLFALIGILISLSFIFLLIKWKIFPELLKVLRVRSNFFYLSFAIVFYLFTYFFRALRFKIFFSHLPVSNLFYVVVFHTFFNNFLPFRIGEASFPVLLKKFFSERVLKSSVFLIVIRMSDFLVLFFFFLFSLLFVYLPSKMVLFKKSFYYFLLVLTCAMAVIFIILIFKKRIFWIEKYYTVLLKEISVNRRQIVGLIVCTTVIWFFKFLMFYFVFKSIGLGFGFFQSLFISAFGELSSVLPVSGIAGIGTYEAGLIAGFFLLGLRDKREIFVYSLYVHFFILLMSLGLAFCCLFLCVKIQRFKKIN